MTLPKLFTAAIKKWMADKATRLGAALAYYAVFAIAPLIVVAVSVAGLVLGEEAAQGEIVGRISETVGEDTAAFIEDLVASARGGGAVGGAIIGFVLTLVGASALVVQLRGALNVVWDVPFEETKGLRAAVAARASGVVMVFGIGVLLMAVLAAGTMLAGLEDIADVAAFKIVAEVMGPIVSILVTGAAFGLILRFLPAASVTWREALVGGTVTAVLFTVGSWALSRYLGTGTVGAGFGAAAALVVLLVFVYYSAQIVLFGAEFARVYGLSRTGSPTDAREAVAASQSATARERRPVPVPVPVSALAAFAIGVLIGWWRRR